MSGTLRPDVAASVLRAAADAGVPIEAPPCGADEFDKLWTAFHPIKLPPLAYPGYEQMRAAILAVLDLHADDGVGFCRECSDEFPAPRPCPTLRMIAENLGIGVE